MVRWLLFLNTQNEKYYSNDETSCQYFSLLKPSTYFGLEKGNLSAWASQVALVVRNLPADAGDAGDVSSIPGWGRSPGEGNGNALQCSYLENPMNRGS